MPFARRAACLVMWLSLLVGTLPQLAGAAPSPTTTITVGTTADDNTPNNGSCSLREAIIAGNKRQAVDRCAAGVGQTSITLPAGTYHLTMAGAGEDAAAKGDLDVSGDITILGAGSGQTIIDASGLGDRVFQVLAGAHLALQDLTIRGGNVKGDGGGIASAGKLELTRVVVTGNTASGDGGGIAASGGTVALVDTTISQDTAVSDGGGIALNGATAAIVTSAILSNTGGTSAAKAAGNGGGIFVDAGSRLTLTNTTVAQNTAEGLGGGISTTKSTSRAQNSAILVNDTIVGNKSGQRGGGYDSMSAATLLNTIIAGNSSHDAFDCFSATPKFQSIGANLVQDSTDCGISGGTVISGKDPKLGPLGNYGGSTLSFRPLLGSPAIDAGTNAGCPATDQRGVPRPGVGTGKKQCDIGSVELSTGLISLSDDNTSWPHALPIDTNVAVTRDSLNLAGQSRWYKFHVDPSEQVTVTLTNLPANYDLTLYKDIKQTFINTTPPTSNNDLAKLGAEFAPDAFTPDAFSPDAFTPDAFTPDAFTPDAFTPDAFTPDAFTPDAFTPDAFTPDAFTPDAFTPDAFTPDAFTPDAFTPDAFTPDAFTSAQTRSLIGASAFNGTASEGIRVNTWDLSGDFYIRVRGRNGAFDPGAKFTVEADVLKVGCDTVDWNSVAQLPTSVQAVSPGGKQTLILVDSSRLSGDGTTSFAALQQKLNVFAALPSVNGVVVDVGADPNGRVAKANALADATPTCPYLKNVVADSIKAIVDNYRQLNPNVLKYVVIVGNDDVIPFYRYPDQALLGSEKNFVPPVKDTSASQASLKEGYVLSQDRYGAAIVLSNGNSNLPIPQLPVGRLVETTSDIATMLDAYMSTSGGVLTPHNALVTGYDFVADDACAVKGELAAGLGAPTTGTPVSNSSCAVPDTSGTVASLITNNGVDPATPRGAGPWNAGLPWTASDLQPLLLQQRNDLVFLAGHFSAASALAADFTTRLTTADLLAASGDFSNEIWFSIGCHSGYNTVNADDTSITVEPDWAEATAQKGITLIAGTGYQYGDTDFIKYSEQIYLNFAAQLHAGSGSVSLGQALVDAKLQYLTQAPPSTMSGVSEKAFLESTLFGLPMLSVNLPAARGAAQPPAAQPLDTGLLSFTGNPGATLGLSYQDITLTPALTQHTKTLNGANQPAVYYSGPDGIVVSPLAPVLPFVSRSAAPPSGDKLARGVGFFGGDYTDLPNTLPLTGAATTEQITTHLPFHSSYLYPDGPWSLNYLGYLGGYGPPLLQVTPAQYQSNDATSDVGTLRLLNSMNFRLFFSSNTQQYPASGTYPTTADIPALAASPAISQVLATQAQNGDINFAAHVEGDPLAGIQEVWVTFTVIPTGGGAGKWVSLDLTQATSDSTLWQANLPLAQVQSLFGTQDLSSFRFMVQAANGVGLVTLNTNLGSYFKVGAPNPNPALTALSFNAPPAGGIYGTTAQFSATLSSSAPACYQNQTVFFGIGAQRVPATTDGSGVATATIPLLAQPGPASVHVSYGGGDACQLSSDSAPFTIQKQDTHLSLTGTTLPIAIKLTDDTGHSLRQRTIVVEIDGGSVHQAVALTTNQQGVATLDNLALPGGAYTLSAYFGSVVTLPDSTTVDLTDELYNASSISGPLTVGPSTLSVDYTGDYLDVLGDNSVLSAQVTPATDLTGVSVSFGLTDVNGYDYGTQTVSPVNPDGSASINIDNSGAIPQAVHNPQAPPPARPNVDAHPNDVTGPLYSGIYTVTTSVSRDAVQNDSLTSFLVIYYPYLTTEAAAAGWIPVPNGDNTDRGYFGLLAEQGEGYYGGFDFSLPAQNIEFRATSYYDVSISAIDGVAGTAEITGSGSLNGTDGYTYVVDLRQGEADQIRVQIFDSQEQTVFDSDWQTLGAGSFFLQAPPPVATNVTVGGSGYDSEANTYTVQYGDPLAVVATLLDSSNNPMVGEPVYFSLDNTQGYHAEDFSYTDYTGQAPFDYTTILPDTGNAPAPGTYTLTVSFHGDGIYQPSSATVTVVVEPENAMMGYDGEWVVPSDGSPLGASPNLTEVVTQEDDGYPGDITMSSVSVNIDTLDGSTEVAYGSARTDANGHATIASGNLGQNGSNTLTPGVYQVNAVMPTDTPSGNYFTAPEMDSYLVVTEPDFAGAYVASAGWFTVPSMVGAAAGVAQFFQAGDRRVDFGFYATEQCGSSCTQLGTFGFSDPYDGFKLISTDVSFYFTTDGATGHPLIDLYGGATVNGDSSYSYEIDYDVNNPADPLISIRIWQGDSLFFDSGGYQALGGGALQFSYGAG